MKTQALRELLERVSDINQRAQAFRSQSPEAALLGVHEAATKCWEKIEPGLSIAPKQLANLLFSALVLITSFGPADFESNLNARLAELEEELNQ